MSYDLFSYACLNTVGSVAHFVIAIAFGKECGMNSCGMNAECLTDAQTQKHKFFGRALTHLKILENRERLGITLVHEKLLSLQEAVTSILLNTFSILGR